MKIVVDSREQLPLWKGPEITVQKLEVGDYTTELLLNKIHVERKSGIDLYGSIIQGHERFRNELLRAHEHNITLKVFVECSWSEWLDKKFEGAHRLQQTGSVLWKIVKTMSKKYDTQFVWCPGREAMRAMIIKFFQDCESQGEDVR